MATKKAGGSSRNGRDSVKDEALVELVRYYTREAGVRNMERELAKLCRKSLTKILKGEFNSIEINSSNIEEFLGVKRLFR